VKPWLAHLVFTFVMSGCFGGPTAPLQCSTSESPPCSEPELNGTQVRRLELLDCQTFFMFLPADGDKLQAMMPPGYTFTRPFLPTVSLDSFVCQSAVIDNATVVRDFRWYSLSGGAKVPDKVQSPDGRDLYFWEVCMNLPEVQEMFRSAGFNVCNGTVAAEITMNRLLGLKFYQAGVLTYDYQGAGEGGNGTVAFPESVRVHHYNGSSATWFDMKTDRHDSSLGEAGPFAVHGGVISPVMLNPSEVTVAHSGIGRGRFSIEFTPMTNQR
jgi:hypothetical protein